MPALPSLCSIVGKRADSRTVQNKLTDIVANANRGDYRVRVGALTLVFLCLILCSFTTTQLLHRTSSIKQVGSGS